MNSQIKFRGFHECKDGPQMINIDDRWIRGYWVYGIYYPNGKRLDIPESKKHLPFIDNGVKLESVIRETVGQYTNTYTKDNKDIYEGDTIKCYGGIQCNGVYEWDNTIIANMQNVITQPNGSHMEIVSDIFQTALVTDEMLKKDADGKNKHTYRGFCELKDGTRKIFINGTQITGEWVYGYLCLQERSNTYYIEGHRANETCPDNEQSAYKIIPETIGQYIAINDVSHVSIYEHDIIKGIQDKYLQFTGQVIWVNETASFGLTDSFDENDRPNFTTLENFADVICDIRKSRIIGNIFENPDLLEETQNVNKDSDTTDSTDEYVDEYED